MQPPPCDRAAAPLRSAAGLAARGSGAQSSRTRRAVRTRRLAARVALVAPALVVLGADLSRRGARIAAYSGRELAFYAASWVAGALLWATLLALASRRSGVAPWAARALLVAGATLAFAAQLYTFDRYQAYVNHRAVLVGTSMLPSIGQQLWFDRWSVAKLLAPTLVVVLALPMMLRSLAPLRRRRRTHLCLDGAAVALLVTLFVSPTHGAEQGQSPDVLYLSAMGQLARARWDHNETVERVHPGPRTPLPVPAVAAHPPRRRNVIFVLTESVRAQSYCNDPDVPCRITPAVHTALPTRHALNQMRAVDSTTAISLAVMWAGVSPGEERARFHTAPLLWEYAKAAGYDTAYWTSQNLLFGNSGTWLEGIPVSRFVSATQLDGGATYETGASDALLVDHVVSQLGTLREPYVAVVHASNTHFPYEVDPDDLPFTPQSEAGGPGYEDHIRNRYHDSIYLQDKALGRLMRAIRARPDSARTVIVLTSDHGEQMREKGGVGHTGTLYEPEIRIPFFVDAPPETLTEDERASLVAQRETPRLALDVLPTLLDLMGVWDAPELGALTRPIRGRSLLRGGSDGTTPVFLTNCSEHWACAFKNWGVIHGTRKVIASQADHAWRCYDVADDPDEERPLAPAACADLAADAERLGRGRPF